MRGMFHKAAVAFSSQPSTSNAADTVEASTPSPPNVPATRASCNGGGADLPRDTRELDVYFVYDTSKVKKFIGVLKERTFELHNPRKFPHKNETAKHIFNLGITVNVSLQRFDKDLWVSLVMPDDTLLLRVSANDSATSEWFKCIRGAVLTARMARLSRRANEDELFTYVWDVKLKNVVSLQEANRPADMVKLQQFSSSNNLRMRLCIYPHVLLLCEYGQAPSELDCCYPPLLKEHFVQISVPFVKLHEYGAIRNASCMDKTLEFSVGSSYKLVLKCMATPCQRGHVVAEMFACIDQMMNGEMERHRRLTSGRPQAQANSKSGHRKRTAAAAQTSAHDARPSPEPVKMYHRGCIGCQAIINSRVSTRTDSHSADEAENSGGTIRTSCSFCKSKSSDNLSGLHTFNNNNSNNDSELLQQQRLDSLPNGEPLHHSDASAAAETPSDEHASSSSELMLGGDAAAAAFSTAATCNGGDVTGTPTSLNAYPDLGYGAVSTLSISSALSTSAHLTTTDTSSSATSLHRCATTTAATAATSAADAKTALHHGRTTSFCGGTAAGRCRCRCRCRECTRPIVEEATSGSPCGTDGITSTSDCGRDLKGSMGSVEHRTSCSSVNSAPLLNLQYYECKQTTRGGDGMSVATTDTDSCYSSTVNGHTCPQHRSFSFSSERPSPSQHGTGGSSGSGGSSSGGCCPTVSEDGTVEPYTSTGQRHPPYLISYAPPPSPSYHHHHHHHHHGAHSAKPIGGEESLHVERGDGSVSAASPQQPIGEDANAPPPAPAQSPLRSPSRSSAATSITPSRRVRTRYSINEDDDDDDDGDRIQVLESITIEDTRHKLDADPRGRTFSLGSAWRWLVPGRKNSSSSSTNTPRKFQSDRSILTSSRSSAIGGGGDGGVGTSGSRHSSHSNDLLLLLDSARRSRMSWRSTEGPLPSFNTNYTATIASSTTSMVERITLTSGGVSPRDPTISPSPSAAPSACSITRADSVGSQHTTTGRISGLGSTSALHKSNEQRAVCYLSAEDQALLDQITMSDVKAPRKKVRAAGSGKRRKRGTGASAGATAADASGGGGGSVSSRSGEHPGTTSLNSFETITENISGRSSPSNYVDLNSADGESNAPKVLRKPRSNRLVKSPSAVASCAVTAASALGAVAETPSAAPPPPPPSERHAFFRVS